MALHTDTHTKYDMCIVRNHLELTTMLDMDMDIFTDFLVTAWFSINKSKWYVCVRAVSSDEIRA